MWDQNQNLGRSGKLEGGAQGLAFYIPIFHMPWLDMKKQPFIKPSVPSFESFCPFLISR